MTKTVTRKTVEQKRAEVDALKAQFETWEGEQDEIELAAIIALHDGYSDRNALLIAMQLPDATDVRGFRAWLDQGRVVRKGEHGARILAPAGKKDDAKDESGKVTEKGRQFFKLTSVFDVSQTEPLPEKPATPKPLTEAEEDALGQDL